MICEKCKAEVSEQDVHEHAGLSLCDECYIDMLAAPKTCDPWAVYSATRTPAQITSAQQKIVDLINTKGPLSAEQICSALNIDERDFQSNFSTLRHMELAKACKQDGQILYIPFAKK